MKNIGIDKPFELESIPLDYQKASLPGFLFGLYGAPAGVGSAQGNYHPYWQIEFDPDAEERCWWYFTLPRNFLKQHAVKVKIYWKAHTAVAGNVVWAACVLGRKEGENLDVDMDTPVANQVGGEVVAAADDVQGAADELTVTEITLPPATHLLEEKDAVVLRIARKSALDTMADDADVVWVDFEFARDANILVA